MIKTDEKKIVQIEIDKISPNPHQPRVNFNPQRMAELAESIGSVGLMKPVLVRQLENGDYELIAGERRWRAHNMLGLKCIDAIVREVSEEESEELAVIENIQNETLTITEEGRAMERLVLRHDGDKKCVAKRIGKSVNYIAYRISLLALPGEALQLLDNGSLNIYQAKVILEIPQKQQVQAAHKAIELKLSPDEIRGQMQRIMNPRVKEKSSGRKKTSHAGKISFVLMQADTVVRDYDFSSIVQDLKKKAALANQIRMLAKTLKHAYQTLNGAHEEKGADE